MFPSVVDAVRAAIEVQRRAPPVTPSSRYGSASIRVTSPTYTQGAYVRQCKHCLSKPVVGDSRQHLRTLRRLMTEIKNQPDITTTPLGEFELKNVEE